MPKKNRMNNYPKRPLDDLTNLSIEKRCWIEMFLSDIIAIYPFFMIGSTDIIILPLFFYLPDLPATIQFHSVEPKAERLFLLMPLGFLQSFLQASA